MQAVRIVDQFSALSDVDFASFSAGKVAKWDGAKLVGSDFVASLNTRTGAVTLTSGDVTGALTYTPVNRAGDQMSGLLSFGGITSSFPALKNSSAHLQVRLADDSGFGQLDTAAITVVAGNVVLDNAQSYRIKDNAGNIVSVINLTGGNNVQYNTSTVSGSLQFQVLNSSGTIPFLLNGTERVR
ncbi:MAG TPA: hypothetical protein VLR90_08595, partial [Blastocatellia bacterium]|nr:hypothetical protein [Blastocatellia bacterium]